jgi:hypothetical protein
VTRSVEVCALILTLLLTACSRAVPGGVPPSTSQIDTSTPNEEFYVGGNILRVVTLKDGTHCAVFTGGGIDCDWHHTSQKVEQ